jgi:hypothetical protein
VLHNSHFPRQLRAIPAFVAKLIVIENQFAAIGDPTGGTRWSVSNLCAEAIIGSSRNDSANSFRKVIGFPSFFYFAGDPTTWVWNLIICAIDAFSRKRCQFAGGTNPAKNDGLY